MAKNKWFSFVSVADIKSTYRKLAMQWHPDRGGDTDIMAEINEAYHAALKIMDGSKTVGDDDREHTYHYSRERETAAMNIVRDLLKHDLEGCEIHLIGNWVWVTGETKPHKNVFKNLKMRWHSKRVAWYWRPVNKLYRPRYNSKRSLDDLKMVYVSADYETTPKDNTSLAA